MIKINLLGVAATPAKVSAVSGPPAPKATQVIMFVGALVVAFGIVGVLYKVLSNQIDELGKQRTKEKTRQAELALVKAQNAMYQQRLKDLETRINTIQALQNSRTGPVELMTALGNVANRLSDVFLYTMTPGGDRFQLKGQSGTVESMANFLAYMKNSGFFTDVQLDQFYQDDIRERLTYKFTMSAAFKSPSGGVSPTSGADASAMAMGGAPATQMPIPGPAGRPMPPTPEQAREQALGRGQAGPPGAPNRPPGPPPGTQGQGPQKLIR